MQGCACLLQTLECRSIPVLGEKWFCCQLGHCGLHMQIILPQKWPVCTSSLHNREKQCYQPVVLLLCQEKGTEHARSPKAKCCTPALATLTAIRQNWTLHCQNSFLLVARVLFVFPTLITLVSQVLGSTHSPFFSISHSLPNHTKPCRTAPPNTKKSSSQTEHYHLDPFNKLLSSITHF